MVALTTPEIKKGWHAQDFNLISVDNRYYNLESVKGKKGLVIAFICNHCPYVRSIATKIVKEANELKSFEVNFVAINSNDFVSYPEDSFEKMKIFAETYDFNFPYLLDKSQDIAKKYGAVCTPDFFGFNAKLELNYRGRLDASRKISLDNVKRELFIAMSEIAMNYEFNGEQFPSIGCSIKWK